MLLTAKNVLETALKNSGISTVYTEAEDESKIKGIKYAQIVVADPERLVRDGESVVVSNNKYYICEYEQRLKIGVRIVARTAAEVTELKSDFLCSLIDLNVVKDTAGFEMEIQLLNAEFVSDRSVLKTGYGYDIYIEFSGGIYKAAQEILFDPWLAALSKLSKSELGEAWKADQCYPLGRPDRNIYWKVQDTSLENQGSAGFTLHKQIIGYVFGQSAYVNAAATKLAQSFQMMFKLPLNMEKRIYMTLEKVDVNFKNNAHEAAAQISLNLYRMTGKPTEDAPIIMQVIIKGELQNGN